MEQRYLGLFALALMACGGPSNEGQGVKTPDEIVAEQEQLGDQQLQKERTQNSDSDTSGATDEEKKREWDDKQSDLELRNAVHSAETCPDSVAEDAPVTKGKGAKPKSVVHGKATVSLLFQNDGHVKSLTVSPPYDENAVGKCVQRAMNAVIVPAYVGSEHTVEWDIDLSGAKKSAPVGAKADE
jgi:hypothetical protein